MNKKSALIIVGILLIAAVSFTVFQRIDTSRFKGQTVPPTNPIAACEALTSSTCNASSTCSLNTQSTPNRCIYDTCKGITDIQTCNARAPECRAITDSVPSANPNDAARTILVSCEKVERDYHSALPPGEANLITGSFDRTFSLATTPPAASNKRGSSGFGVSGIDSTLSGSGVLGGTPRASDGLSSGLRVTTTPTSSSCQQISLGTVGVTNMTLDIPPTTQYYLPINVTPSTYTGNFVWTARNGTSLTSLNVLPNTRAAYLKYATNNTEVDVVSQDGACRLTISIGLINIQQTLPPPAPISPPPATPPPATPPPAPPVAPLCTNFTLMPTAFSPGIATAFGVNNIEFESYRIGAPNPNYNFNWRITQGPGQLVTNVIPGANGSSLSRAILSGADLTTRVLVESADGSNACKRTISPWPWLITPPPAVSPPPATPPPAVTPPPAQVTPPPAPVTPPPAAITPPPPAAANTCESQGMYTYTGPSRPGVRFTGMCIACPETQYLENGGSCTRPVAQVTPPPPARPSGRAEDSRPPQLELIEPVEANQTNRNQNRNAASTPTLTNSQRVVRAPERGDTGPAFFFYAPALLASPAFVAWIRRKRAKKIID